MALGDAAHKFMESGMPPSAAALEAAGLADLAGVFASREWRELAASSPERELPFMLRLEADGADCWIRGRIDAAAGAAGENPPRVIDYKYSAWREGRESDYEIQMTAYALALMRASETDRALAELWYLRPPLTIRRREYTRAEAGERLRVLLSRYLTAVNRDEWPAAERAYCDRIECGFRDRCW
jgi:hypothetical protein